MRRSREAYTRLSMFFVHRWEHRCKASNQKVEASFPLAVGQVSLVDVIRRPYRDNLQDEHYVGIYTIWVVHHK
jgi:hypothetical protein